MKVASYLETPEEVVQMEGAKGVRVRWVISDKDGAPNFAMRHFTVEPGGHTPKHSHPYEHEVYILEGEGEIFDGTGYRPFKAGDVIFVAPNEEHQFRNTGTQPLRFLCLIPLPNRCC